MRWCKTNYFTDAQWRILKCRKVKNILCILTLSRKATTRIEKNALEGCWPLDSRHVDRWPRGGQAAAASQLPVSVGGRPRLQRGLME